MKSQRHQLQLLSTLVAGVLMARIVSAQTEVWSGSGTDQNWSTAANWDASVVPGAVTNIVFTNNASAATSPGNVDNIVDSSFAGAIASLQFANTNTSGGAGFYHTTKIDAGQTLTVLGSLRVGYGLDVANSQISAAFTGSGTLLVSNLNADIDVSQGDNGNNCSATLNLTNLDNFSATAGGILVGVYNAPNPATARQKGYLYLARTNVINLLGFTSRGTGNQGQIEIGENLGNGSNLQIPLYLGMMNTFDIDSITVGGDKQGSGALLAFNPVFTNLAPVAVFRGTNGASSRVSSWIIADNSNQSTTGSGSHGNVDFSNGSLDALVDRMIIGEGDHANSSGDGSGKTVGAFAFNTGTNDVNTLYLGYRDATGASVSAPTGIMNVNGTGTLVANGAICLSYNADSTSGSYALGTLNINDSGTVLARTITNGVAGGANGTADINMTGGTLAISSVLGVVGTPDSPLINFSISDATLQLPVSGIQTNIEAVNFTPSGTTNVINIGYIPAIYSFPATYPLIGCQNGVSSPINIGLGSLPPATPAYQGYITNDANTVYLVLTSGPTFGSSVLEWSGANGSDWDYTTANWLYGATPATYFDAAVALFDDNATGSTAVNVSSTVLPAGVMVSNNILPYAFSGAGIGGVTTVAKYGSGTLLFTNSGNTFAGGLTIHDGSVQFGDGGASGNLPSTGNVLDNGNLIFNHSGNVSVPNTISGSGMITKNGTSTLTISASNDFSGTALVNHGTLLLNGVLSGDLTNAAGTTLGGSGTNAGPVNASGLIQPSASTGTPATFTVGGALQLSAGATLAFNVNAADTTPGNGVNDLVSVGGDLNVNNNTVSLNFNGVPQIGNTYTLVNFNGTQNGSFNPTVIAGHFAATLNQGTTPVTVTLTGSGASLKWDSTSSQVWDVGATSNWLNLGDSAQDVFYSGDNVLFDDSVAGVATTVSIPAGVTVSPTSITVNSAANNYSITGPGQISGNVSIVKQGASTLTLSGANPGFTGTATVQGGTLQVGNNNAFGASGTVVATNGGTLDLNGAGLGEVTVVASGTGVGGNGSVVNNGADQIHAVNIMQLSGDAAVGGTGRWDIRYSGSINGTLTSADGVTHNLVKTGNNELALVSCTLDSTVGNIDVQGGTLSFQLAGTAQNSSDWFGLGTANHTISVETNGTLDFYSLGSAYPLYQNIVLNDGSTVVSENGDNGISGNVTLNGNATVKVSGGSSPWLIISGPISGSGNLIVNGTLPLELSGTSTYTGRTWINSGTLALVQDPYGNNGSIAGSSNIVIAAGAILDVSQTSTQTLTLATGQTLQGNGTLNGILNVSAGATVSAGADSSKSGILTVTNGVTLNGNTFMKLNPASATNDVINVTDGTGITYGGTLTLANISASAYAAGQTFKLFNAASYTGMFSAIAPSTPAPGLAWDTNNLASGILGVVASSTPQPVITSIALSGTQLVINGMNGVNGEQYNVLTTTNLSQPLTNWTVLPTNIFSASAFSLTNAVDPSMPQSYFILRIP